MKILHVEGGSRLYGGAQQVLYLLEGLAARGHANLLACPAGCALGEDAAPFAEVHGLPMHGDADLTIAWRLAGLIRTHKPDLVHLHSRIGADLWGGVAARLTATPVVHTRRVDNPEPRALVALKYRLHDRVIAISEGIGRVLLSEGLPPAKLRVVRSAVDWARFQTPCARETVEARLGVTAGALLAGVIAQLIPRKGHRFLLAALPDLVRIHPSLRVLFFGQGPLEAELRDQIAALGLTEQVRFVGFRDDLHELLPCLDLLVHPATLEGLGVSLLQAASAGVPILASRTGGIPEAVRDWINGILVPPGDIHALGAALKRLLADTALRRRLGKGGRDLMRREFSIDVMVEGNLAVYGELLGDGP
jgi:glycosyltransferase involved in cell wall biosynthesis